MSDMFPGQAPNIRGGARGPAGRQDPETAGDAVLCVAAGRAGDLAALVGDEAFHSRCARRYREAGFGALGAAEANSWRNSWPPLFAALERAGLKDLQVYLEYGTPGAGRRLDALLVGALPDGSLGLMVVELKQWQNCRILDTSLVIRSDGLVTAHPVHQVAAYRSFLQHWRPPNAPALDVRAVVVLHNAGSAQAAELAAGAGTDGDIPVLGADDLAGPAETLRELLRCGDLTAPDTQQVTAFESIRWQPSGRLLDHVGAALEGSSAFALVGTQQDAFVRIRRLAMRHLPAEGQQSTAPTGKAGAVITVSGGPGSGKTALAVRLLGYLMRQHPAADPRFVTPSGTLRAHLQDAVSGEGAARELFPSAGQLRGIARRAGALVIDEAQRLARSPLGELPPDLGAVIEHVTLGVVFLDERQIIRPAEGVTVTEIRAAAHAAGRAHHHVELTGSFRCSGSAAYTAWVDDLLYKTPRQWTGQAGYELGLADDPFQLQQTIDQATAAGHTARTTAGFCWPWTRNRPAGTTTLPLDITITVPDPSGTPRTWTAAWNAASALTHPGDGRTLAPHSQLWASHTGGHQQIGCIYTAQGLEYHTAGVLIGPDLTWDNDHWSAHPEKSCDETLRHLTPAQYLPYALNTYRVLLTRGTHTTRIHSTDPATHHMLNRLLPPPPTTPPAPHQQDTNS